MASGLGKRFGSNKLLADFQGKTLIECVLELTGGELFDKRVVLTRSKAVWEICQAQGIEVILHEMPDRNDAIGLGIRNMQEMDGCIFCPCDQPLLRRESLQKMIDAFQLRQKGMFRLSYGERQGAPVLFSKEYFSELAELPPKSGGSYLVRKYPEMVEKIEASEEYELMDIDTKEDLEQLLNIIS